MSDTASTIGDVIVTHDRVLELEAALAAERELRAQWELNHEQQMELIRRRLFVAKAERIDTTQLEIEFAATLAALDALAGAAPSDTEDPGSSKPGPSTTGPRDKAKPTGRRDLPTGTSSSPTLRSDARRHGRGAHRLDASGR